MKRKLFFIISSVLLSTQLGWAQDEMSIAGNDNLISLASDGVFSLNRNALYANDSIEADQTDVADAACTPKSRVYNDKDAVFKVSMKADTVKGKTMAFAEKWYFEVPESVIGRRFLAMTRFAKVPSGFNFSNQQEIAEGMYYFELSPNKKNLLLREDNLSILTRKGDDISKAVDISSSNPIVASFKIDTCANGSYKFEANSLIFSDQIMALHQTVKITYSFSSMMPDRSWAESIHCYPTNVEIRTVRTYNSPRLKDGIATMTLNTSLLLLPEEPMKARLADPRVGYHALDYPYFDDNQQRVEQYNYITRWRLEAKDEADALRQQNGELIEPKKPIVYYIDPSMPKQWRPYVKQAFKDWQKPFEQAGWKNAIYALDWPENDSTMSMEDARYNVVRVVPGGSEIYGHNRAWDYRSGEFLNSYILFFEGAYKYYRDEYVGCCGNVDSDCHTAVFPDELMGEIIRCKLAMAIAPTLGLLDNKLSSSLVPTDSLRSKSFIQKYGMLPSVTDATVFNYVAQPEDNLTRNELIPRVGDYDAWAIEWGYKPLPQYSTPESEYLYLKDYATEHLAANPRHEFASGQRDPKCKVDDLGDDQYLGIHYMLKNLKAMAPNIIKWGRTERDMYYYNLNQQGYYAELNGQMLRAYVIYANNITGTYERPKPAGVDGTVVWQNSREEIIRATECLFEIFGEQPQWMITDDTHLFEWTLPEKKGLSYASMIGKEVERVRLCNLSSNMPKVEFAQIIFDHCFRTCNAGETPNEYERIKQSSFVSALADTYKTTGTNPVSSDECAVARMFLQKAKAKMQSVASTVSDPTITEHYKMLIEQVDRALFIE